MRVAVSFPGCYRRGGVERVVLETANHLARRGHEVHLFCHEWDAQAVEPGVATHGVPLSSRLPLSRIRDFPVRCHQMMQQAGTPFDAHGGFGVLSPPGGTIWVQSVHAAWLKISHAQRGFAGRLKQQLNPYHHLILRLERAVFGARRYRRLIALTDQVKQDLIDHYAVPHDDIAVLSNGFSESEFNVARRDLERERVRAELGYHPDHRVVIFVANETERKGFGPLVRAVASLDDPAVRVLAVGRLNGSPYQGELVRLGLADRVRFTGPSEDVARYFAAADLFALPTQYEAWGLVIVEAMACGLPVLTSRLAGAAVAVREGDTGELLDDPRDEDEITRKLRRLLDGPNPEPQVISDSVQQYRWANVLTRYEEILRNERLTS